MKVAIAVWENRVSSVLDFSQRLVVVELKSGGETSRAEIALSERNAFAKLVKLRELGIDVLICGAVSRPLASASAACGIRLLPYVTGRVDDVLNAYQAGQLDLPAGGQVHAKASAVGVASTTGGAEQGDRQEASTQIGEVPPTGTESERSSDEGSDHGAGARALQHD